MAFKHLKDQFLTTFSLVSRVRHPFAYETDFSRTGFFLPLIGLPAAVMVFVPVFLIHFGVSPVFLTLITLFFQYTLYNLFHFDGLLDSADAMFPWADKEKRLAILKDSNIGSFAFFAGFIYLAAKAALLYELFTYIKIGELTQTWPVFLLLSMSLVSGRTAAACIPVNLPCAREKGLGSLLGSYSLLQPLSGFALGTLVLYSPLFLLLRQAAAAAGSAFGVLTAAFWGLPLLAALSSWFLTARWYRRKIGGYTGDALGLGVELGELIHLALIYVFLQLFPF